MRNESEVELLAPENFAMVEHGVYRSSFPRTKNISFLQRLNLKSVVSLVPEDYPEAMIDFYKLNGTRLFPLGLDGMIRSTATFTHFLFPVFHRT
jgi:tyrosine-protein phosphatase SIW14